jgi:hypothetical protein
MSYTNCFTNLDELIDFVEAKYNFNELPYIEYPKRVTNILYSPNSSPSNQITEAPFNGLLHGRINGQWQSFSIPNSYTQAQSDARYYPLSSNPAGYITIAAVNGSYQPLSTSLTNIANLIGNSGLLRKTGANTWSLDNANYLTSFTETDPIFIASPAFGITSQNITNWNNVFSWGNHNLVGYALANQLHDAVTLGTVNGLSLTGQQLSLALATIASNGAMSAADKVKLDSVIIHNPVTLSSANGLSLNEQVLSLALATPISPGAMSGADKEKLDTLSNYTHPTGFTNQPINPLTGPTVISRITVNNEGHVTGVSTRAITANDLGIVPNELTKVDDTNVTLTLGGTPATSLLQAVSLTLGWTGLLAVTRGGTGANTFTAGQVLIGNGTNPVSTLSRSGIDTRTSFPPQAHTLGSHSDVNFTTPSTNQVLGFNGSVWTNITLDLDDFAFSETDPVFVAFRDTVRTQKTFYAAPTDSNAIPTFRTILTTDLPDVYVRFDINQTLTELQKQRVRTNLGITNFSGSFEPAFSKGDIITTTSDVISLTNATDRLVGLPDLIINHAVSGWVNKLTLTGANIISNLTVDKYGHIADWTTRELTLADLGFVAFDPSTIEATLDDHEDRISALELAFPLLQGDKHYVHVQSSPATIWTYTHNMGKKPSITIIDSAGSQILAKITYVDSNNVEIDFDGVLTSGEAINN